MRNYVSAKGTQLASIRIKIPYMRLANNFDIAFKMLRFKCI